MRKIILLSDNHGHETNMLEAIRREGRLDFAIHLGDIGKQEEYLERITKVPCFAVAGNCDMGSLLPKESIVMIGNHRAFITHGHRYSIDYGPSEVVRHAIALGCDIVVTGHTHVPLITEYNEVTVLNPGSIERPRQGGRIPTYMIGEIDDNGEVTFTIKYLEE